MKFRVEEVKPVKSERSLINFKFRYGLLRNPSHNSEKINFSVSVSRNRRSAISFRLYHFL